MSCDCDLPNEMRNRYVTCNMIQSRVSHEIRFKCLYYLLPENLATN